MIAGVKQKQIAIDFWHDVQSCLSLRAVSDGGGALGRHGLHAKYVVYDKKNMDDDTLLEE